MPGSVQHGLNSNMGVKGLAIYVFETRTNSASIDSMKAQKKG